MVADTGPIFLFPDTSTALAAGIETGALFFVVDIEAPKQLWCLGTVPDSQSDAVPFRSNARFP